MLQVTHYYREARATGWSIEGIFQSVKQCLTGRVAITDFYCDGSKSRFSNTMSAKSAASTINHITGDVNFLALGLIGRKTILTIHDLGHYGTLRKRSKLQFLVYKVFWLQLPLKCVSRVTVISNFTKQALISNFHYPENKISVIGDPVKQVFVHAPKNALNEIPRILHIGTSKHKNIDGLFEAVKGMKVHLDIVAMLDDGMRQKLKEYNIAYTEYGRITDEELNERYTQCDFLYFASFYEGFGMPIIEAQFVGRPVITSNLGAMKEVAADTALLVDPHNIAEIKAAIQLLSTDKTVYDHYVALGLENVKKYDCGYIAEQYLALYEELAAAQS